MKLFPNVTALANASQVDVLRAWKGLGYNSRALRMKKTAEMLIKNHKGVFPKKYEELLKLPGIGPYTAGAICAFAYNEPVTMIETNIRRVYLHHFFEHPQPPLKEEAPDTSSFRGGQGGVSIHDRELMLLIGETVDTQNPRQWYWALMDYGSYLAKTIPNPNKKSRHYAVQKKFKGSDREIRGKILEVLLSKRGMEIGVLLAKLADLSTDADRIELIISVMESEGFLFVKNGKISLVK
jgi:A/G-specific adenine glycosylase